MAGIFQVAEVDGEADLFSAIDGFGYVAMEWALDACFDGDVLVNGKHGRPEPEGGRSTALENEVIELDAAGMLAGEFGEPAIVPLVVGARA